MTWSAKSKAVYDTLDPRMQKLVDRINAEVCEISLLVGFRDEHDQNLAFATGRSKLQWPNGNHNKYPSLAVDLCPYPVNLKAAKLKEELAYIAGAAKILARQDGFEIRWGGDWDRDGDLEDNTFDDLFHLEIHNGKP